MYYLHLLLKFMLDIYKIRLALHYFSRNDIEIDFFQVQVKLNPNNGKVIANEREESSVSHIFAIGDMLDGKPELTPVAIQV
jgi:thioredoxin reductase